MWVMFGTGWHIQPTYGGAAENCKAALIPPKHERRLEIFLELPLLAHLQPPNLRQLLVIRSLDSPTPNVTSPYLKKRYKTSMMNATDADFSGIRQDYKIQDTFNCTSSNLVYLIRCAPQEYTLDRQAID